MSKQKKKEFPKGHGTLDKVVIEFTNVEFRPCDNGLIELVLRDPDGYERFVEVNVSQIQSFECSHSIEFFEFADKFGLYIDMDDGSVVLKTDSYYEEFPTPFMSAVAETFGWEFTGDDCAEWDRTTAFEAFHSNSCEGWYVQYLPSIDSLQIGCETFSRKAVEKLLDWYALNWWWRDRKGKK